MRIGLSLHKPHSDLRSRFSLHKHFAALRSRCLLHIIFVGFENLRNEKIVYIKMNQYEISAKIPSNHTIENTVGFNSKDIFVFDENGKRFKT